MGKTSILLMTMLILLASAAAVAVEIPNSDFESETIAWTLPDGFSIKPLEGLNSSRALYVKRSSQEETKGWASQPVTLEPGKSYRVSCYAKANITEKGKYKVGASFILSFYDGKRKLDQIYNDGLITSSDGKWVRLEREFTVPLEQKQCILDVGLYNGFLGEAWFDDLHIELDDQYFVYVAAPGNRLLYLDEPQLRVVAVRTGGEIAPGTVAKMDIVGQDFSLSVTEELQDRTATLKFNGLHLGPAEALLSLLAPDGKTILAQEKFQMNIVESANRQGSHIDIHGRLLVDGKPFMPLGFYIGQLNKDDIDMISDAGFNTVLPYASMYLRFNYGAPGNPAELRKTLEVMDYCQQKGLRLVFSIANVWEEGRYAIRDWYGTKGPDEVVKAAIKAFGKHPAMLAWYIYDEPPASKRETLIGRRALVNENDPDHVTFLVSMHFNELYNFASGSDVGGVDPYPIANRIQDMYQVRRAAVASGKLHKPFWGVPQIFNQAYYTKTTEENHHMMWHEIHRDPSEEEIRSMCFRLAQSGARGFIFYYWSCIKDTENRSKDPEYFPRNFAKMKKIAATMKTLEPYLLSVSETVEVPLAKVSGKVLATKHYDDNQNPCILITAEGPGPAEAVLQLEGNYRSLFNRTECHDGEYHFQGENISSDMLVLQGE